jgi:hypothetical protein
MMESREDRNILWDIRRGSVWMREIIGKKRRS